MSIDVVDWASAELPVLNEPAMAEWLLARGKRVIEHRGRFWVEVRRAFFQPVHELARLRAHEATRPAWWCVGFRARLAAADLDAATGAFPAHLMDRVDSYDFAQLAARRRQQIRQAMRSVEIVVLRAPDLVLDQGYAIMQQAHARNSNIVLPAPATFRRDMISMFDPRRGLVLAGVRDGRLLAFATVFAVDSAAYHDYVYVGDDGLPYNLSLCFFHALATLAARRSSIRELMHGLYVRDDPGLAEFKRRLGLIVTPLPIKAWFVPGVRPLLRRISPEMLYRWSDASGAETGRTAEIYDPAGPAS